MNTEKYLLHFARIEFTAAFKVIKQHFTDVAAILS